MPKAIRPIRIEGNIAYVTLSQGYEAVIDTDDIHLIEGSHWFAQPSRTIPGLCYARRSINPSLMHRVICDAPRHLLVDHKDHDGLNNRRGNLRSATHGQNQCNKLLAAGTSSGLKGASWHKRDQKWMSQIAYNGVNHGLGYYDTAEEAHAAYCEAAVRLHGEFARFK